MVSAVGCTTKTSQFSDELAFEVSFDVFQGNFNYYLCDTKEYANTPSFSESDDYTLPTLTGKCDEHFRVETFRLSSFPPLERIDGRDDFSFICR